MKGLNFKELFSLVVQSAHLKKMREKREKKWISGTHFPLIIPLIRFQLFTFTKDARQLGVVGLSFPQ